jgi:hypothetical protein
MTTSPDLNLSADLSSLDQIKEIIDPDIQEMIDTDNRLMDNFRALLNRYRDELATDITEMAKGLKISRPLLSDFMNKTEGRNDLPLTPGKIYHLHATLTQTEKLSKKRRTNKSGKQIDPGESIDEIRTKSQAARDKLKRDGLDEMLMTAGYLPRTLKLVPVSPQQYSQLSFISFLYKGRPLNPDLFSQVVQQEIDRTEIESRNQSFSENLTDQVLIDRLDDAYWLEEQTRKLVETKYKKAIKTAADGRNRTEKIALFKSVFYNQLSESEGISLNLRVTKIEYISLSLSWPKKDSNGFSELLNTIEDITTNSEIALGTFDEEELDNQNKKRKTIYPVLRTIVTCEYNDQQDVQQEINLEFISRGTHIAAAIHAVALNMGFSQHISSINVDVKWLGEDMKSLVSAIVKIGDDKNKLASGEWVSSDLLLTIIQATISAGKKWMNQKVEFNLGYYENIFRKIAEIRIDLYENRAVFDKYDFENRKGSINQFKKINSQATEWIGRLKKHPMDLLDLQNAFLNNFYRAYFLSKLYMLHHYSNQVNHKECYRLIKEIDAELYNDPMKGDKSSIPIKIELVAEKIAYNISFGIPYLGSDVPEDVIDTLLTGNLLDGEKYIINDLEKLDSEISSEVIKYIDKKKPLSDPGYDIHYSLGLYYFTTSRLLFYRGKTEEEFESAFNRSIQAAYYFQRIGLSRKVQRSIILAGRISLRVPTEYNKKRSKQCELLSKFLMKQSTIDLNIPDDDSDVSLSLRSRLNLLEGEYIKATTDNNQEIFTYYLRSLRGSLWLGLNRHLADTLYMMSKHIQELKVEELKSSIKVVFRELFPENSTGESFTPSQIIAFTKIFTKNAGENPSAGNIVRQLFDMYRPSEEPNIPEIANKLRNLSYDTWNSWHHNSTGDENSSHPFADEIRDDIFLHNYNFTEDVF